MAKGGFDAIVGNPPYVRQESLGELKNYFQKHYKVFQGTADLYTYFIERGVSLLKPAGRFSYIVGNKWMKTSYGVELRKWLKFQALEEVIDFADLQVFKGATTYTCILTIKKDKPSDLIRAANVETLLFGNLESYLSNKKFDIHFNILTDSGWSLTNKSTSDLLSKMKETGVHLGDLVGGKIFRGLITGLNEAFVISAEKRNELLTLDVRSDEIIKPFLAGRDIKRYEHLTSEKYIITIPSGYTNSHRDGKDSWTWFANTYPAIATHLKPFEKAAQARWDKGEYWWELRSCDYYNEFEKPKLFLPDISQRGNFAIDNSGGFFSVNTVYFISSDDLFLMGVLNSRLMTFFYSNNFSVYSGGYLRFFTQYLKLLPIPNLDLTNPLDKSRHDGLVSLVDQMLEAKKRLAVARSESERTQLERKCAHLDHEIDKRVYELYDLTDEEIGIVEGNV